MIDTTPWPRLRLDDRAASGSRNEVWRGFRIPAVLPADDGRPPPGRRRAAAAPRRAAQRSPAPGVLDRGRDWDESRVDVVWHDLSNLGVQVLDDARHVAALRLSDAWEAANAWLLEPDYARRRLARLGRIAPETGRDPSSGRRVRSGP